MTAEAQSDALVFFGITGDLAHKKIFPALYEMVKQGHLDMPVRPMARSLNRESRGPRARLSGW